MDPTSCISISSDEQEDVENNEFSDEAIAFCSSPVHLVIKKLKF